MILLDLMWKSYPLFCKERISILNRYLEGQELCPTSVTSEGTVFEMWLRYHYYWYLVSIQPLKTNCV